MNLKFFFIALVLGLLFWWGINSLEMKSPRLLTAQINQLAPFEIEAKSAISVLINEAGEKTILFEKNADEKLPIASLTKLMTASIVLEIYDLDQIINVSGEKFRAGELLASALIESSNQSASALADIIGEKDFVRLMNLQAEYLGLKDSSFANSTGLDSPGAYSTAQDLIKLTEYLLEKPIIWEILSLPERKIYTAQGDFHHLAISTNELLGKIPAILGGKTGETPNGQGCLLLMLEVPEKNGYLINIILGSEDRFGQMEKLIEKAYAQDRIIFNNTGGWSLNFL